MIVLFRSGDLCVPAVDFRVGFSCFVYSDVVKKTDPDGETYLEV